MAAYVWNYTISANTMNFNLRNTAVAAGWNQSAPLVATITVNGGIVVGSSSTSAFAFITGSSFPAGSTLRLNNNGWIVGAGGAGGDYSNIGAGGGPALQALNPIIIYNAGTIGGGGGGGGGGAMFTRGGGGAGYTAGVGYKYSGTLNTGGSNMVSGTWYSGAGGNLGAAGGAGNSGS